jgi:aspartokinase-like uncharacterized kinase
MMHLEAVLKIGGSLGRGKVLVELCQEIGQLGKRFTLLVVPGGGDFADLVRHYDQRYRLSQTTAHRMALSAMDQYGCLLGDLIPSSILVEDLLMAHKAAKDGQVPILLPSGLVIKADPLPHSWQVTSDSIAAWVAGMARASKLILLKDVDGLYSRWPTQEDPAGFISNMSVERLSEHHGGVDEYLSRVLSSLNLETWVINGLFPSRLAEILSSGNPLGTRILRNLGASSML